MLHFKFSKVHPKIWISLFTFNFHFRHLNFIKCGVWSILGWFTTNLQENHGVVVRNCAKIWYSVQYNNKVNFWMNFIVKCYIITWCRRRQKGREKRAEQFHVVPCCVQWSTWFLYHVHQVLPEHLEGLGAHTRGKHAKVSHEPQKVSGADVKCLFLFFPPRFKCSWMKRLWQSLNRT